MNNNSDSITINKGETTVKITEDKVMIEATNITFN